MTWTWIDFLTLLTQDPLAAFQRFGAIAWANGQHNWWRILFYAAVFWASRTAVFWLVDFLMPRRMNRRLPKWLPRKMLKFLQGRWQDKVLKEALENRSLQRSRAIISLVKSTIDPLMGVVVFFTMASLLGLTLSTKTSSILIGSLSLAVGLGTQGIVKDMIAGITILIADAYAVGDYIDVQFGASGVVKHIGVRYTTLEAPDGTIWSVRHSEIPKVGNLTAAKGVLVTDVELTWSEEEKHIKASDLKHVEEHLDETLQELSQALDHVDRMARTLKQAPPPRDYGKMVTLLPDLVPDMTTVTLTDLKPVEAEAVDPARLKKMVSRIPGRVPVFTKVETLGLVASAANSLTLRLRITLPPKASRAQAMSVLRRAIFEAFIEEGITCLFHDVDVAALPMEPYEEELFRQLQR